MTMTEIKRLILGLRKAGWDADKINNFLIYIESGEEKYLSEQDEEKEDCARPQ